MSTTCEEPLQGVERLLPVFGEFGGAGQKALLLVDFQRGDARRAGDRMAEYV